MCEHVNINRERERAQMPLPFPWNFSQLPRRSFFNIIFGIFFCLVRLTDLWEKSGSFFKKKYFKILLTLIFCKMIHIKLQKIPGTQTAGWCEAFPPVVNAHMIQVLTDKAAVCLCWAGISHFEEFVLENFWWLCLSQDPILIRSPQLPIVSCHSDFSVEGSSWLFKWLCESFHQHLKSCRPLLHRGKLRCLSSKLHLDKGRAYSEPPRTVVDLISKITKAKRGFPEAALSVAGTHLSPPLPHREGFSV